MTTSRVLMTVVAAALAFKPCAGAGATPGGGVRDDRLLRSTVAGYACETASDQTIVDGFTRLSANGDPRGTLWLARLHFKGVCGLKANTAMGQAMASPVIDEVRKMAEDGDAEAQFLIGVCHHEGLVVDLDPVLAGKWYLKAVEKDQLLTFGNLAELMASGSGMPADIGAARKILKRGAALGSVRAKRKAEFFKEPDPDAESMRRFAELRRNRVLEALGKEKDVAVRLLAASGALSTPDEYIDNWEGRQEVLRFHDDGIMLRIEDGLVRCIDARHGMTDSDAARGGIPFGLAWDDSLTRITEKLGPPYESGYIRKDSGHACTYRIGNVFFTAMLELSKQSIQFWRVREIWREDLPDVEPPMQ